MGRTAENEGKQGNYFLLILAMFAVGVIGLSVAIFTTYGIGGMKEQ